MFLFNCGLQAQELAPVCDSVFAAVKLQNYDLLKSLVPSYNDLKTVYDSSDMDLQAQQILTRQKEIEWRMRRDFKRLGKFAKAQKIPLKDLEFIQQKHPVNKTPEGRKFSPVEVECSYRNKFYKLYFTAIYLNENWYLGEELRMEIYDKPVEAEVDYDKIDREVEQRKAAKRKLRQQEQKAKEKEERERQAEVDRQLKEEEARQKEAQKKEEEKNKEAEQKKKATEKEVAEKAKAAEKKKKEEAKESQQKEKEKTAKEKQKEKKRLLEEKEKARKKEAEEKVKERERLKKEQEKERERLKKENEERKNGEKK